MWIDDALRAQNRKKCLITYSEHLFDRQDYWNLELDKIEETIRSGKLVHEKCEEPNKICFQRYFGKKNLTYVVIAIIHENFIEVKTTWPIKGK